MTGTSMKGHNSAAYGEVLYDDIETVLSDDHKKLFHYAKWHLGDYITGTQGMSLEHEGAYMRFLVRLYDRGKPFPDDDRFMATVMGLALRVWRRIRNALVAVGKIICRNGSLTNARFERERKKRAEELRKQAKAARERWARERAEKERNAETSAKFGESFDETSTKLSGNSSKKVNEINEERINTHMPPIDQRLESTEKERASFSENAQARKPKRLQQMPSDWRPSDTTWQWARNGKIGATEEQISSQLEHFRDHHLAKGSKFADWDRAFQTWMRNAKSYGRLENEKQGANWSRNGVYAGKLI